MRQWKKRAGAMLLSMAMVLGPAAVAAGAEKTITVTPMALNINGQKSPTGEGFGGGFLAFLLLSNKIFRQIIYK